MRRGGCEEIRRIYTDHPLREARILARLRRDGADLEALRELDLAEDPRTGITDQNHIGGRAAALVLGARAGIRPGMWVLDLCAGLGGTARVLAEALRCRVVCLEITPARCGDAASLNRRVGLMPLVAVLQGDACALPLRGEAFDAVVGQSSWSHVEDKRLLLGEAARVVRSGGTVAFEDAILGERARAHGAAVAELARYWCFHLEDLAGWHAHLAAAGLRIVHVDDLGADLLHEARRIRDYARRQYRGDPTHAERWAEVVRLAEARALSYVRMVAVKG
jgi:SAM-dependent methyltransferase